MRPWYWRSIVASLLVAPALFCLQESSADDQQAPSMSLLIEASDKSWFILRDELRGDIVLLLDHADRNNGAGLKSPTADPPEPILYDNARMRADQQAVIAQDLETRVLIEIRRITKNSTITPDHPDVTPKILRQAQRLATDGFVYDHAGVPPFAALALRGLRVPNGVQPLGSEQLVSRNLVVNSNIGPLNLDWLTTLGLRYLANKRAESPYLEVLLTYLAGKTYWNQGKKYEAAMLPPQDINAINAVALLSRARGRIGVQHFLDPAKAPELKSFIDASRAPWEPEIDVLDVGQISQRSPEHLTQNDLLQFDNKYARAALIAKRVASATGQSVSILADASSKQVAIRLHEEFTMPVTPLDRDVARSWALQASSVKPVTMDSEPRLPSFWTSASGGKPYGQTQTEAGVLPGLVHNSVKSIAVFGSDPATDLIVKGIEQRFGATVKVLRHFDDPDDAEQQRRARASGADAILGVRPRRKRVAVLSDPEDRTDDCNLIDDCDALPGIGQINPHCFGPACGSPPGGPGTGGGGGGSQNGGAELNSSGGLCQGPDCGPGGVLVDPKLVEKPGNTGGLAAQIRKQCNFRKTPVCDLK